MIDDESLLSAYLDGELDSRGRLDVEAALLIDPRLADRLHELATVRDLIAGLPRTPPPGDLADAILAKIATPRDRGRLLRPARLVVAAAAASLLAATLGWAWIGRRGGDRPDRLRAVVAKAAPAPRVEEVGPAKVPEAPAVEEATQVAAAAPPGTASEPIRPDELPEEVLALEADRGHIREWLDSPNLRKVFIVTDVVGGEAGPRVGALLQQTARGEPRFGRITVAQGIVVDPKHPDRATVYALVMDEDEMRHLGAKLRENFPDAVEEEDPEPTVVTQLADIGQVAVLSGISAPKVTIPAAAHSQLALRHDANAKEKAIVRSGISQGGDLAEVAVSAPRTSSEAAGRAARSSGEDAGILRSPSSPPIAASGGDEGAGADPGPAEPKRPAPSIVLVWVTHPERRAAGGGPKG